MPKTWGISAGSAAQAALLLESGAAAKLSALSELSVPALEDKTYVIDDPSGTPISDSQSNTRLGGLITHTPPQFRLSRLSGSPVPDSGSSSVGTLYWTPIGVEGRSTTNGYFRAYDGTRIRLYKQAEVSLALTITSGKNYDVFIKASDGSLVLSAAWTNDTTRADALTFVEDLIVASADNTYLWVGTIRASGTNLTSDALLQRFIWNAYNQVPRPLSAKDITDSWSYATGTWRQANGATANKVEFVTGGFNTTILATVRSTVFLQSNSARAAKVAIGINSITAPFGQVTQAYNANTSFANMIPMVGSYNDYYGAIGYGYIAWLEFGSDGTCVFLGDDGGNGTQSGLQAIIYA